MARRVGFPVVVKPLNGNHGRGITVGLNDEAGVMAAYEVARDANKGGGRGVLIDAFIHAYAHRMLVVGDTLVSGSKPLPARAPVERAERGGWGRTVLAV